jgi:GTPase SAR1 family protein
VNLDPAIEDEQQFDQEGNIAADSNIENNNIYTFSITDLITLQDVMEEMELGPNGALMYCMEFFITQMHDWLSEQLQDYSDDYLIFDCPGQIELYSHVPLMRQFTEELTRLGYRVATVYCMDAQFVHDPTKFMSGTLMALSAMTMFQDCPHYNILTKVDIVKQQLKKPNEQVNQVDIYEELEDYLNPDTDNLLYKIQMQNTTFATNEKFLGLHKAIAEIISEYNLVSFIPFDVSDEESIEYALSCIDHGIQYGEDLEPHDPYEDAQEEEEGGGDLDGGGGGGEGGDDLLASMYGGLMN